MTEYGELVRDLRLPCFVSDFISGKLPCPFQDLSSPPDFWRFPPVLIPIWSDNGLLTYHGIWKHWFLDRNLSFVEYRCRGEYRAVEIARTPEQFALRLVLDKLYLRERVDAEVERLADAVGVEDLDILTRIALDPRPDNVKLAEHPAFSSALPLEMCKRVGMTYDGEFPSKDGSSSVQSQENCCWFEFEHGQDDSLEDEAPVSELLSGTDKQRAFETLLDRGEFGRAWLCLNSPGWELVDAHRSIEHLAAVGGDPLYKRLAELWRQLPEEDSLGDGLI